MPAVPLPSPTLTVPAVPTHWRFPARLASVPRARQVVRDTLPRHCPAQLSYELRLLTSELVTNAILHGTDPEEDEVIELVLWTADGHYWLAVSDPGPGHPTRGTPGPRACGGRGLLLVDALCDAWAVLPRPTRGKSVVAGIRLDKAA
ncbi:ATP-binding protein [Kitasatospora sp. GAS204B]|uniref:ATP-binding protein n=1 Tax=unclassified Kitasatospora TaxID=2633591 RepID=UPI002473E11D|nr:ATP-binding protein [Kitasatospora sp. GAS204B]MDH6116160.1 anti-sigma regulatory factor (Ser/Thr protein kinase) [Kitasatospora sp. GAS204B]